MPGRRVLIFDPEAGARARQAQNDKASISTFRRALTRDDRGIFACGGILDPSALSVADLALFYSDPKKKGKAASVATFPLDEATASKLFDIAAPAPHQPGKKKVLDEALRQPHELKPRNFSLNIDPVNALNLTTLSTALLSEQPLMARPSKLDAYTNGGSFRSPRHNPPWREKPLGTLVFRLPSTFTGGDLVVRRKGQSVTFDWDKRVASGSVAWGFFYSDCEHEVMPVNSGTRISLSYDIFAAAQHHNPNTLSIQASGIHKVLETIFDPKSHFMPQGGTLGLSLEDSYPYVDSWYSRHLTERMEGHDALLLRALRSIGAKHEFMAIYEGENESLNPNKGLISACFSLLEGLDGLQGIENRCAVLQERGARYRKDVAWLNFDPKYAEQGKANYGWTESEASMQSYYAAAVVLVELPPLEERGSPDASDASHAPPAKRARI
ncbi:hypothetical protein P7C73_g6229, partial [Tremellales sp. Uapishka_1]